MKINLSKLNIGMKQWVAVAVIIVTGVILGRAILGEKAGHTAEHPRTEETRGPTKKPTTGSTTGPVTAPSMGATTGPHKGKLFKAGDFGLEVLLVEEAGEARFRIWLYDKAKPLSNGAATVSVTILRPTGETEKLNFVADKDSLLSRELVSEPHAFDASVVAQSANQSFVFALSIDEDKVKLNEVQIKAASIRIDTAGAARIKSTLQLPGEIRLNEDRTSHVVARLSGVVESVQANLGQAVKRGQVLAVIASPSASEQRSELQTAQKRQALAKTTFEREKWLWEQKISAEQDYLQAGQVLSEAEIAVANSLQKLAAMGLSSTSSRGLNRFDLRAPFDGLVIEKHISLGEAIKDDAVVFILSDLASVWAEINVPAKDLPTIRVGEKVTIKATAFDASATGTITFVGSLIGEQTRMAKARAVLANPNGAWRPGLFVNVEVTTAETEAPVTVISEAVQTVGNRTIVFLKVNGGFIAQPVQLGRSDGKRVEVVQGLKAGAAYASTGSFVLKSELGKASAEHPH